MRRAYGKEINRSRVSDIQEVSGNGVTAKVDGKEVAAGNDKLMKHLGVPYQDCHQTGTIIHMAINGEYAGHIVIPDITKPHSKAAIAELKKAGVDKTVMLTGDAKKVADQVAASHGTDEVYSELLPAGKAEKVEELLQMKPGKAKLAFVGDGINDAPVLSRADIGIAMGAMGSDAAIEAADIVLMDRGKGGACIPQFDKMHPSTSMGAFFNDGNFAVDTISGDIFWYNINGSKSMNKHKTDCANLMSLT